MKKLSKRRGFLGKLTKSILALGIGTPVMAHVTEENKKVKLLTPDGKLVEVDQKIIDKEVVKHKASNQEIMDWSDQIKT